MMKSKDYKQDLVAVIQASWFTIDKGTYVYASVEEVTNDQQHLMVVRDGTETTVVTETGNLPLAGSHQLNKDKWKLLNIRCGSPFYCVGFIAYITDALAANGIDIVMISSFSNDLVLVIEEHLEAAIAILKSIGFQQQ